MADDLLGNVPNVGALVVRLLRRTNGRLARTGCRGFAPFFAKKSALGAGAPVRGCPSFGGGTDKSAHGKK